MAAHKWKKTKCYHAGLVAHERGEVGSLGAVILGERSDFAAVFSGTLAGLETQRTVAGSCIATPAQNARLVGKPCSASRRLPTCTQCVQSDKEYIITKFNKCCARWPERQEHEGHTARQRRLTLVFSVRHAGYVLLSPHRSFNFDYDPHGTIRAHTIYVWFMHIHSCNYFCPDEITKMNSNSF